MDPWQAAADLLAVLVCATGYLVYSIRLIERDEPYGMIGRRDWGLSMQSRANVCALAGWCAVVVAFGILLVSASTK